MQHYSNDPSHCRVDFFKENGKWYTTEEVDFGNNMYWHSGNDDERKKYLPAIDKEWIHPVDIFKMVLREHLNGRLKGMWAVCLDPYCANGFPLMVKVE